MPQSKFTELRGLVEARPYVAVTVSNTLALLDVCEAAEAVARHDWGGCGISERYHCERMAAMDALRAALAKFKSQK